MGLNLSYPDRPSNNDDLLSIVIRENFADIVQYLSAIPGADIANLSILEAKLADNINPRLRDSERFPDMIYTGGLPSGFTGLGFTIPGGTLYGQGYRTIFTGQAFTVNISKDTYYSVNNTTGIINAAQEVANNAAAPTLAAGSQWLVKVISNATVITSIVDIRNTKVITPVQINNPYKFHVHRAAAWTDGANAFVKVTFDTEDFDTGNNYDTSNGRFTAPIAGFYWLSAHVAKTVTSSNITNVAIFKNGSRYKDGTSTLVGSVTTGNGNTIATLLQLVAGDYIEIHSYGTGTAGSTGPINTFFSGYLVSAT